MSNEKRFERVFERRVGGGPALDQRKRGRRDGQVEKVAFDIHR